MGKGILVCGLNGSGKSTLGRALAEELNFYFIDNEDLYFPKTDPHYLYASPRTRKEVEELFFKEIMAHENFVFTSVKGDYGEEPSSLFQYAVLINVPKEIRMQRVRQRAFEKFGDRMLPGGDLYERQEHFFELVRQRDENLVEEWIRSLTCPVIRVDGTRPVERNVEYIAAQLRSRAELTSMMNIGREMAKKLTAVGIDSPEKLIGMGAEKAFLKLKAAYPQICLVHLYALEGAVCGMEFNNLPEARKKELKEFSDFLKQ